MRTIAKNKKNIKAQKIENRNLRKKSVYKIKNEGFFICQP